MTAHAEHPASPHGPPPTDLPPIGPFGRLFVPAAMVIMLASLGWLVLFQGIIPKARAKAALEARVQEHLADKPRVVVTAAIPAPVDQRITLPARLEAAQEAAIFPREGGYIRSLGVDIGDRVHTGQKLAEIDTPVLDQQIQLNDASQRASEAHIAEAAARLELSNSSLSRLESVPDARAVSQQSIDDARSKVRADTATLAAAKADLESMKAEGRALAERKALATIVAPFDGEISQRGYDAGALVIADKTDASKSIFRITARDEIRVFIDAPQLASTVINTGDQVALVVRELPGRTFSGRVVRAAPAMDTATRTRLIEARVPNPDHALLPGMFADAILSVPRNPRPVLVPGEAIVVRGGKTFVAVIDDAGAISYRAVVIGRDTGATVEINSGLAGNERVALSLARQPPEGTIMDAIDRDHQSGP